MFPPEFEGASASPEEDEEGLSSVLSFAFSDSRGMNPLLPDISEEPGSPDAFRTHDQCQAQRLSDVHVPVPIFNIALHYCASASGGFRILNRELSLILLILQYCLLQ